MKIQDKLMNRIIEGDISDLSENDAKVLNEAIVSGKINASRKITVENGFDSDLSLSIRAGDIIYDNDSLLTGLVINDDGGELHIYVIDLDNDTISDYYYNAVKSSTR